MEACALDAYSRSIKPFHGVLLGGVFRTMMGAIPPREKFLAEMAKGKPPSSSSSSSRPGDPPPPPPPPEGALPSEAAVLKEMAVFVEVFGPLVETLHNHFVEHGLDDPWKA